MNAPANNFKGFQDLAETYREGLDYRVQVLSNPDSTVAVIAPHGGRIEPHTSEIASEIAGSDFNLYRFEGIRRQGNYAALHLTSHRFDASFKFRVGNVGGSRAGVSPAQRTLEAP